MSSSHMPVSILHYVNNYYKGGYRGKLYLYAIENLYFIQ